MPVIPRTEKNLQQLVCCGGGFGGALLRIKCSWIYETSTPPWLRRLRCFFSKSEGREFKPSRDQLFKGFGNLYSPLLIRVHDKSNWQTKFWDGKSRATVSCLLFLHSYVLSGCIVYLQYCMFAYIGILIFHRKKRYWNNFKHEIASDLYKLSCGSWSCTNRLQCAYVYVHFVKYSKFDVLKGTVAREFFLTETMGWKGRP